ncbi:MAG: spore maturation protein [Christensenellales bacterium]
MNVVFLLLSVSGLVALTVINPEAVFPTMINGATNAITLCLKLLAIYSVWLSVLKMLEKSGLDAKLTKLIKPVAKRLFKGESDETYKYISINLASNMLGMGGAATPAGIKAMELMDDNSGTITHNMNLLLVISATSIQLIPATVIALRSSGGSISPTDIMLPTLLSTAVTTAVGIIACKIIARSKRNDKYGCLPSENESLPKTLSKKPFKLKEYFRLKFKSKK